MGDIVRRVKINNIDEDKILNYHARSLKINVKDGNKTNKYEGPQKICNHIELKSKADIPSEIPLHSIAGILDQRLNQKDLLKFLKSNTTVSNKIQSMENYSINFLHFPIRTFLLQPHSTGYDVLKKDSAALDRYFSLILSIAKDTHFNTLMIPSLKISVDDYINIIDSLIVQYLDLFKEFIPTIDFQNFIDKEEDLEYLLDYIKDKYINTDLIKIIGIIYRSKKQYPILYDIVRQKLYNSDVALYIIGIDRRLHALSDISGPHYEYFNLGELLSVKINRPPPSAFSNGNQRPKSDYIRFFNKNDITISTIPQILSKSQDSFEDSIKTVFEKDYRFAKDAVDNYMEVNTDEKKYSVLRSISKIHEFVSSKNEFNITNDYVVSNGSLEYIKNKPLLYDSMQKAI